MNPTPQPTPTSLQVARAPGGRFGPGNKAAKGNPYAKRVARLRKALFEAVKPVDLKEVVAALMTSAKSGDVPAAKELLQRLLGPPVELDFIDRMETLERTIAELQKRNQNQ
jgi:hypothetical protein